MIYISAVTHRSRPGRSCPMPRVPHTRAFLEQTAIVLNSAVTRITVAYNTRGPGNAGARSDGVPSMIGRAKCSFQTWLPLQRPSSPAAHEWQALPARRCARHQVPQRQGRMRRACMRCGYGGRWRSRESSTTGRSRASLSRTVCTIRRNVARSPAAAAEKGHEVVIDAAHKPSTALLQAVLKQT